MRKEMSHSYEMKLQIWGGLPVASVLDPLKARGIALQRKRGRSQTNLNRTLLLCSILHGIRRSKEEQMAQGREREAQMEPRSPPVPATACSLTRDKREGQIVQNALTNYVMQNP